MVRVPSVLPAGPPDAAAVSPAAVAAAAAALLPAALVLLVVELELDPQAARAMRDDSGQCRESRLSQVHGADSSTLS